MSWSPPSPQGLTSVVAEVEEGVQAEAPSRGWGGTACFPPLLGPALCTASALIKTALNCRLGLLLSLRDRDGHHIGVAVP